MKNGDKPARPSRVTVACPGGGMPKDVHYCGMTKREEMAMYMHAALLSSENENFCYPTFEAAAEAAVKHADALLQALEVDTSDN